MAKRANNKCALEGASSDLFGEYLYSLIETNIQKLTRKFYSIVSEQDKDDLVQEIWLEMQDNREIREEDKNFKGWVYICCRNHFYSFARKRVKKIAAERTIDFAWGAYDSDLTPDRKIMSKEAVECIWDAVSKLSPEQKEVAEMLAEEIPYSKMAQTLDCTENTLRGRIFRLRKNLRVAV